MIFSKIFKNNVRKNFIVILCVVVIATAWYFEKSKRILQYSTIFYEMGLNCKDECSLQKQLEYFQKALYYNPNQVDANHRLALIYEKKGDHANALKSFIRATEIDDWNSLANYKVGLYYFREGAYEYARRYFLQAGQGRAEIPKDRSRYLARIYDHWKEYKIAVNYYCNFVWTNPEYAQEIYPRVAEIYHLYLDEVAMEKMLHGMRHWHKYALANQLEQHFKAFKFAGITNALSDDH